ncbi:DUF2927 domain-containing protein [Falsirhodobacter sp. 1013]|uniref:DUF2927 domain-containing protein n=1 Tax=Falsirhodobacter sp. 1013 TaxID=3417566 RepID=UPI003EBFA7CE
MRVLPFFLGLCLAACASTPPSEVERELPTIPSLTDPLPPMKMFGTPDPLPALRSNAEMARDFLDLSFAMESGSALPVMSRFEGPITVGFRGKVPATAQVDLDRVLSRMRNEAKLNIRRVSGPAEVVIEFVPTEALHGIAPTAACFVVPNIGSFEDYGKNLRNRDLDWSRLTERRQAAIFIPSDESPQEIRDCLNEELAQSVGPLNDLYRIPDTIFNDDNFLSVLTGFDMLMLRIYNAPEMHTGMTREEAARVVPTLLRRYNPKGDFSVPLGNTDTPRSWNRAIETAFGPDATDRARLVAAQRALRIAADRQWIDARMGFSWFAIARLSLNTDVAAALEGFLQAARVYRTLPDQDVHAAHVDMQMAAFALSSGQLEAAMLLTDVAIPVARQAENAGLLSTLLMIRSEALRLQGDTKAAKALRRESLGWGRYGFKNDADVRQRLAEVAALAPPF